MKAPDLETCAFPVRNTVEVETVSQEAPERCKLAYFVSHYPKLTETFIADEVKNLANTFDVSVVPIVARQPNPELPAANLADVDVLRESLCAWSVIRDAFAQCLGSPGKVVSLMSEILGELVRHPKATVKTLLLVPRSLAFAYRLRQQPVDVLYAGFANYSASMAWMISRLSNTPFMFVAHANDIFKSHVLLAKKCRDASAVLAISKFNRNYLLALDSDLQQGHFRVVPTGVDCSNFVHRPYRALSSTVSVLSVGSLLEKKGHRFLIDAMSMLIADGVNVHCQIIGEGPERNRLQQQIEHRGIGDQVSLLGSQDRASVNTLLEQADIFVLASVDASDKSADGIPVALMEAMAVGVPVISTRLRAIPELVIDGKTGLLCEPGSAPDIAACIERLIDDEALHARLLPEARQHVEQYFDQASIQSERRQIVVQVASQVKNL